MLVVGVDPRTGLTHHEEVVLHVGNGVSSNSDTLMLVHVSADRSRVTVVSIPRDSWVNVPGHGMNKINAAYGLGGAKLMVQTVEQATGLTIDDYVEVDFLGFVKVIDALGGVNICLPQALDDPYSGLDLSAGMHHVDGITALAYARDRHSFATSDLARIQDQQRLLSSALSAAIHSDLLTNPIQLSRFINAALSALTVNQGLNVSALADQMRGITAGDVTFMTVPLANVDYQTPTGELAVQWDSQAASQLFQDLASDQSLATPGPSGTASSTSGRAAQAGNSAPGRRRVRAEPGVRGRPRVRGRRGGICAGRPDRSPEHLSMTRFTYPPPDRPRAGPGGVRAGRLGGTAGQTTCNRVSRLSGHARACATTLTMWPICGKQSPGCRSASRRPDGACPYAGTAARPGVEAECLGRASSAAGA